MLYDGAEVASGGDYGTGEGVVFGEVEVPECPDGTKLLEVEVFTALFSPKKPLGIF